MPGPSSVAFTDPPAEPASRAVSPQTSTQIRKADTASIVLMHSTPIPAKSALFFAFLLQKNNKKKKQNLHSLALL